MELSQISYKKYILVRFEFSYKNDFFRWFSYKIYIL